MNDLYSLQKSFDDFNKATATLEQAYANLEKKFDGINRQLEEKNLELENKIIENREMKNYLHNILESLANGVVVTDLEGNIKTINHCAEIFTDLSEADVKGKHISSLFEDFSVEKWRDASSRDYLKGEAGQKIKLKDRTLELFCSPVSSGEVGTLGTVFILRDVTRIEKLEDMAKRKEKLASMGEMAANIAHEIRNPLGSIELFASLLMKDLKDQRDLERVAKIVASVKNVDNKISNLLLFTKNQISCAEHVNVNDVLKETLVFAEPLAAQGNVDLVFEYDADEAFILGDAEMLKQVFLNIILNAFQAMPEGGRLHIEIKCPHVDQERRDSFLEIIFTDNGVGIPDENITKIFDPLFSTREGTSGLGLAIVHNIVDMHKGLINVEKGKDGGTVFTLMFPMTKNVNGSLSVF